MAVTITEEKQELNAAEIQRRSEALRQALSNSRIEGQFLDQESLAIFDAFARGEINLTEVRQYLDAIQQCV